MFSVGHTEKKVYKKARSPVPFLQPGVKEKLKTRIDRYQLQEELQDCIIQLNTLLTDHQFLTTKIHLLQAENRQLKQWVETERHHAISDRRREDNYQMKRADAAPPNHQRKKKEI